ATGFLGHVSLGGLDPRFLAVTGTAAVIWALAGSWLARFKLSGAQLKRIIGVLLWGIAVKIVWGLL
ncbi:MAG: sulfite exporter TauE/SafE family protein, partial [Candidatus Methylomirabilota bacterium]